MTVNGLLTPSTFFTHSAATKSPATEHKQAHTISHKEFINMCHLHGPNWYFVGTSKYYVILIIIHLSKRLSSSKIEIKLIVT